MNSRIVAIAAFFLSFFAVAGAAQAAPAGPTGLVLSTHASEVDDYRVKVTWLDCSGRDEHPRSAAACAQLAAVSGDLAALSGKDRPCPMIYAPVEARMVGFWRGEWVSQSRTFPNSCVLAAHTGAVFDF